MVGSDNLKTPETYPHQKITGNLTEFEKKIKGGNFEKANFVRFENPKENDQQKVKIDFNNLDFYIEKTIQKHSLRGVNQISIKRGQTINDPSYFMVDYLNNKKKITLRDIWEIKNPNAKMAKIILAFKNKNENKGVVIDTTIIDNINSFLENIDFEGNRNPIKSDSEQKVNQINQKESEQSNVRVNANHSQINIHECQSEVKKVNETEAILKDFVISKIQRNPQIMSLWDKIIRESLRKKLADIVDPKKSHLDYNGEPNVRNPQISIESLTNNKTGPISFTGASLKSIHRGNNMNQKDLGVNNDRFEIKKGDGLGRNISTYRNLHKKAKE